jgi:cadmium resistance protein CadD (predicted permease)
MSFPRRAGYGDPMHDVIVAVAIGVGAFVGTMVDNFFAFAAQLVLTEPKRFRRVSYAHVIGVLVLLIGSAAVGSALNFISLEWIGVLAVAPLALAWHGWRHRNELSPQRRGATTTFLVTVGLGGDNLAIWIPILRAQGVLRGIAVALTILVLDIGAVFLARYVVKRPSVIQFGQRWSLTLMPPLYCGLAVLIVWQCGWLSFLG